MTGVRTLTLLAAVYAAMAAPRPQEMAAPAAGSLHQHEHTVTGAEDSGAGASGADMNVSVSSSTSMKITTMTSSVSTELGPLPAPVEEDISANEIGDDVSSSSIATTENEEQIKSEAEGEMEAEVEAGTETAPEAEHNSKAVTPASAPTSAEFATSVSMMMTEMTMPLSSEMGDLLQAFAEHAGDSGDSHVVSRANASDSKQEPEKAGSGEESAIKDLEDDAETHGISAAPADEESNTDGDDAEDVVASVDDEEDSEAEKGSTTKGTLIFDLGPEATPELHDLVQQTVLDALMDEGLLASADVTPVFEVEGSGVVFNDDVEGSAGYQDGSGEIEDIEASSSSPYVSIHF